MIGALRAADEPLWFDEAVTVAVVRRPAGDLLSVLMRDEAGMTPYYFALWAWSKVFGSDLGLTMFSVLGGGLAVLVVFELAARRLGTLAAFFAAVLTISNPFFLTYLTEIRAYSWVMAVAATALLVADQLVVAPRPTSVRLLGVLCGLLVALHLANAIFVLVLVGVTFALLPRSVLRSLVGPTLQAVVLGGLVVAIALPALLANPGQVNWIPHMSARWARDQAQIYLGTSLGVVWFLLLILAVAAVLILLQQGPATAAVWWGCGVAAPAILALVSLAKPLWLSRYLAASFPAVVLTVSFGVAITLLHLNSCRVRDAAWGSLFLVVIFSWSVDQPFEGVVPLGDARAAAEWIDVNRTNEGVVVVAAHDAMDFYHYFGFDADIDRTLIAAPGRTDVYPQRAPWSAVGDDELDGEVFVYLGTEAMPPDMVPRFRGREVQLVRFSRVRVLHVMASGTT